MPNEKPVKVQIVDDAEGRFIVKTYADGSEEREPVMKLPRKKRYPPRPYWQWVLRGTKKQ